MYQKRGIQISNQILSDVTFITYTNYISIVVEPSRKQTRTLHGGLKYVNLEKLYVQMKSSYLQNIIIGNRTRVKKYNHLTLLILLLTNTD